MFSWRFGSLHISLLQDIKGHILTSHVRIGQLVSCVVLQVDDDKRETGKGKVWLSLRLFLLHKSYNLEAVQEGMVCVRVFSSFIVYKYIWHKIWFIWLINCAGHLFKKHCFLALFKKYVKPTPVQRHAIPIFLAGRDLMVCAQTGSGKTAAFCFPIVSGIMRSQQIQRLCGYRTVHPLVLIPSPTRELSMQMGLIN